LKNSGSHTKSCECNWPASYEVGLPEGHPVLGPVEGRDSVDAPSDRDEQRHDDTETTAPSRWTGKERRRPGRLKFTNPQLIALLRGKTPTRDATDAPDETAGRDDLGPAKGIMGAIAISAMIWGAVALIVLALWR
jgi:hypothetical protein